MNSLGTLFVQAKLIVNREVVIYKRALPNHRFTDEGKTFIGEILFDSDSFDYSMNGEIVDVHILADSIFQTKLEKNKSWYIYSGSAKIGKFQLYKILRYEPLGQFSF